MRVEEVGGAGPIGGGAPPFQQAASVFSVQTSPKSSNI